jgi:predicted nucleic acid-binding protein
MSRFVVDASVGVKWYLPEVHDAHAKRLLIDNHELLAPDLIFPEVGNIFWKRIRAGQMVEVEAQAALDSFCQLAIKITPTVSLISSALAVASRTQRTVYDSLYLALAIWEKTVVVTADEKFYNAVQATPLASYILWIENIP